MAKRQIILFAQVLFLTFSCRGQSSDLVKTKWVKEGEFCYDSLFFISDKEYKQYYCDTQSKVTGKYQINGDTLILTAYQKVEDIVYELPPEVASNPSKVIPTYLTRYLMNSSEDLQSSYFEDFITGYKQILTAEGSWNYIKIE